MWELSYTHVPFSVRQKGYGREGPGDLRKRFTRSPRRGDTGMNRGDNKDRSGTTAASYLLWGLTTAGIIIALYVTSTVNYLLFHAVVEFAALVVASVTFLLVWNTRRHISTFFLIIGFSLLFTGGIDLLHTLAFKGMGVFGGAGADPATQLWIAARYFQSIAFFAATLFIGRSITKDAQYDTAVIFSVFSAVFALLLAAIFVVPVFPACYLEGSGLTFFKIASEYIISLILLATILMIYRNRGAFDPEVWRYLLVAQGFLIASEPAFTSYANVYGPINFLGHIFRLCSVYFFYRAIIVVGLTRPYDLIFHELSESRDALRESERKNRITMDAVTDGLWTWDIPLTTGVFSSPYYRLLGYEPGELPTGYDAWCTYIHPVDLPLFKAVLEQHIRNGTRFECDLRMKTKAGDWKWIRSRGSVVERDAEGKPIRLAGIHHDITDRKEAEDALRESEERYRTLLRIMPVPLCLVDSGGAVVYLDDHFTTLFQYTRDDIPSLEHWWVKAYPDPSYRQKVMETWENDMKVAVMEDTDIMPREYRVTKKNGDTCIVEISGIVLGDQFLATFLDVTDRRKAEEALREANRKLNILNSITRHDILNQLMGMNGFLTLTKMKVQDPVILGYLQKQENAAKAIQRQIEFTRFYQDIGLKAAEWHDVEKTITDAILQLNPPGVTLDVNLSGLEIFADPLVEKVFYNLMENSLRHGEHVTRMMFSCQDTDDGLVLIYRDDGVGITDGDRTKLFQKGFGKNTGLGLFLSREILLITGITITENGEQGTGVRFEMKLPKGVYRFAKKP